MDECGIKVFVATTGEDLKDEAFLMMGTLRDAGISCDMEYEKKSLKSQMKKAEKLGSRFVIIFGEEEFRENKVILRDMVKRSQEEIGLVSVAEKVLTF